jgi:hypothetical protein
LEKIGAMGAQIMAMQYQFVFTDTFTGMANKERKRFLPVRHPFNCSIL